MMSHAVRPSTARPHPRNCCTHPCAARLHSLQVRCVVVRAVPVSCRLSHVVAVAAAARHTAGGRQLSARKPGPRRSSPPCPLRVIAPHRHAWRRGAYRLPAPVTRSCWELPCGRRVDAVGGRLVGAVGDGETGWRGLVLNASAMRRRRATASHTSGDTPCTPAAPALAPPAFPRTHHALPQLFFVTYHPRVRHTHAHRGADFGCVAPLDQATRVRRRRLGTCGGSERGSERGSEEGMCVRVRGRYVTTCSAPIWCWYAPIPRLPLANHVCLPVRHRCDPFRALLPSTLRLTASLPLQTSCRCRTLLRLLL